MELSAAPMGAHPAAGGMPGPGSSHPAPSARCPSVRCPSARCPSARCPSARCPSVRQRSHHNRGRSRQTSPAPGSPGPCPSPVPVHALSLSLGQPGGQSPPEGHPGAKGCPHLLQPHLPGLRLAPPRCFWNFSFGRAPGVQLLLDFPRPSEPELFRRSFLGNEQPPAESPTPPVLCYCSCQVLNVAAVVVVTTPSHFAFN